MDEIDENSDILQKCDELLEIIDDEEIQEIEVVDEFANKLDPVKKEITEKLSANVCKFCQENCYDNSASGMCTISAIIPYEISKVSLHTSMYTKVRHYFTE